MFSLRCVTRGNINVRKIYYYVFPLETLMIGLTYFLLYPLASCSLCIIFAHLHSLSILKEADTSITVAMYFIIINHKEGHII